jgi:hypothetical protein
MVSTPAIKVERGRGGARFAPEQRRTAADRIAIA